MTFKTERDYQTFVMKRLRDDWWFWVKYPDVNRQIKPFDIQWVRDGTPYAIELKISDYKHSPSYEQIYKMLRPNQVAALDCHQKAWGVSEVRTWNKSTLEEIHYEFKLLSTTGTEL